MTRHRSIPLYPGSKKPTFSLYFGVFSFFPRVPKSSTMNLRKSKFISVNGTTLPNWTATSTKRKRIYDDATDAISSRRVIAKVCADDKQETPETPAGSTKEPGTFFAAYAQAQKKHDPPHKIEGPRAPGSNPSIDWEERKAQREMYPNIHYTERLMDLVMEDFKTLANKFGREQGGLGPSMLWHLLPAVMEGVQNTPWEYFCHYVEEVQDRQEEECICFINYTYGDRGQDLSINQNKFRKVLLTALKEELTKKLRRFFEAFPIEVIFSKKFFDSI